MIAVEGTTTYAFREGATFQTHDHHDEGHHDGHDHEGEDPSSSRVTKVRDLVKDLNITCVFSEPQYNAGLVNNVFEGTSVKQPVSWTLWVQS